MDMQSMEEKPVTLEKLGEFAEGVTDSAQLTRTVCCHLAVPES